MFKKIMVTLIAAVMALCSFVGCGGGKDDYGDKTVVQVGIFNGGWGMEWLEIAAEKFEEKNPEYKILVDGDKKYTMATLLGTIDVLPQDVYVSPCYLYDYISQDKLMDVTHEMTTPLKDLGIGVNEDESIADKMWTDIDAFYKGYTDDEGDKYYAAPFGGGIRAISYDIDLFEQEGFFYAEDGTWTTGLTGAKEKSKGQDGVAGTYDDGLPVTEAEFWNLCEYMSNNSVIPFLWSDQAQYTANFIYSIVAAYEGKEYFDIMKEMTGTYKFNNGTELNVTPENAWELLKMDGRKAALSFAKKIADNPHYYHNQSGSASMGFMTAQSEYLLSIEKARKGKGDRIAFFIDGSHWLNEAKDTVNDMKAMSPDYANRRFGVMPFPVFEGQKTERTTYFASSFYTSVFVRRNAEQPEGAKKFFAYLQSDEALQICTQYSGMPRALDYEMTNEQLATMSPYYQNLWRAWSSSDIVYHTCNNPVMYKNEQYFEGSWKFSATTLDGKILSDPISDFRIYPALTVEDYFNAVVETQKKTWSNKLQ